MPGKKYSLHTRPTSSGKKIYYAQFRTPDGEWSTAKSTGCTTRRAAEAWAEEKLTEKGFFIAGSSITFEEFGKDFFSWDGEWATDRKVRGRRISLRHCIERGEVMRNHVTPVFGAVKIIDIDRAKIKAFRNDLYREGRSGSLINKTMAILRAVLETAEEKGIIDAIPKIDSAAENPRPKGILTLDEVEKIFNVQWNDFRGYVGNLIAASTGLRLGELQALTFEDINLERGCITVRRSWEKRFGVLNVTTKTGRTRTIFIPGKVRHEIERLKSVHPNPGPAAFLFFGEKKPNEKPAEQKYFVRTFYRALEAIGINDAARRERNITFHSWRHWFNSLLINAKVPLQKIQSLTGHRTDQMSEHYYHIDDMADVRQIQERIFALVDSGEEINQIN